MNKNYMIYPLKNMRITCRYDEYSHAKHNIKVADGNIDYPIDDGGKDTGKDAIYCPCDEMIVTNIRGVGSNITTNTIWLVSTSQVVTPTFTDLVFITLTHPDDDDIKNIKIGDKFKRGDVICHEGSNGATNNHVHITCGRGKSDGWIRNSNGAWVMIGDSKKPEEIFYIDKSFTNILYDGKLKWSILNKTYVGSPVVRDSNKYQVEVLVDNLNARSSYSINSDSYGYINKGIYDILDKKENEGYLWVKVENYWLAINNGWNIVYEIEEKKPKLIFECNKDGKYIIYLKKGMKLYLCK